MRTGRGAGPRRYALICGITAVVAASGTPLAATAATVFAVDSLADRALVSSCDDGVAGTTLREALCYAAQSGDGIVTVPSGTITLTAGELIVDPVSPGSTLLVMGGDATLTTIAAAGGARVLNLDPSLIGGFDVTLTGLTIRGGVAATDPFGGGAVVAGSGDPANPDTLTLRDAGFVNNANAAPGNTDQVAIGGAVSMAGGSLSIVRTRFVGNTATGAPGGAVAFVGAGVADTVSVVDSTFASNTVTGGAGAGVLGGGGLYVGTFAGPVATTITDTAFTGNAVTSSSPSGARGSAVFAPAGATSVTGSALVGNVVSASAAGSGGAAYLGTGSVVSSSRLVGNTTVGGPTTRDAVRGPGVAVPLNWWGCADPRTSAGCDTAPDAATVLPAAILTAAASPTATVSGGSSTITGRVTMSDGSAVPVPLSALLGTPPVTWSTTLGTLSGESATLGSGLTGAATVTLGAAPATVTMRFDGGTVAASVGLVAPPTLSVPADTSVLEGAAASFTVTAGGSPPPTVTWESSPAGPSTWSTIAGATGPTLNLTGVTRALDGMRYRAVADNGVGAPVTSTAATLTVRWGPQVDTQPASTTVVAGTAATFTVAASGQPTPGVQWQTSPDGTTWADVTGETSPSYVRTTSAADDGLRVRARLTGATSVDSATATLTVQHTGTLTGPADATVAAGAPATFTVTPAGFAPAPTLAWQRLTSSGWADLSGETGPTLTLAAASTSDDGAQFRVVATSTFVGGATATTTSGVATLTVTYGPVLDASPADVVGLAGDVVSFTAAAHGTPTPTVVWQTSPDGTTWTPVSGATGTTYQRTLAAGDDGLLVRAVFTGVGTATTTAATITVRRVPSITTDPADTTVPEGATASFTVAVDGAPTPTIAWESKAPGASTWGPVSGASGATLTVASTTRAMDGTQYRAVASNVAGPAATSAAATLSVRWGPEITSSPTSVTGLAGDVVTFTAAAAGSPTPTPAWETSPDGITWTPVPGETGTSYLRTLLAGDDGLRVRAVFTGASTATTTAATITVQRVASITADPADSTVLEGVAASFTVAVDGAPTPTVTWETRAPGATTWSPVSGASGLTLNVPATTRAMSGTAYRAVATNVAGPAATSAAATLTVQWGPEVTASPASAVGLAGDVVTFSAAAGGSPTPTLAWQTSSDGVTWTPVTGETGPSYLRTLAAGDDGLRVRALFTGAGTAASSAATITIERAPAFTGQPADLTVDLGGTATFTVAVDGRPAPTLQWQSTAGGSWTDLAGETGPTLTFTASDAADGVSFRAVATSTRGVVPSDPATLTVLVGPTVTTPADVTTVPGVAVTFRTTATGRPTPTLTWQTSSDGLTWSDAGSGTQLTLTPTLAEDGLRVRVVAASTLVSGPAVATSAAATLTVMDLPVLISAPPATTPATAGTPVSMRWVVLSSGGVPTWQVSRDGGATWTAPPAGLATTSITGVGLVEALRGAPPATRTAYVATLTPALADDGLMVRLTVTNAVGAMAPSATTLAVVAAATGGGTGTGTGATGGGLSSTGAAALPLLLAGLLALVLGVLALAARSRRLDRRES